MSASAQSLFFLNFGHLAEDKARPFKVMLEAKAVGFELNETIVWVKKSPWVRTGGLHLSGG